MTFSVFDLFKIGVGPSSSHTMGPMSAACRFVTGLRDEGRLREVARVQAELFGSLALTGKGHASDRAVLLGLSGYDPQGICPDEAEHTVATIRREHRLTLAGEHPIAFDEANG
jgi:L-serine dehydratase